jgi:hypothetical protein
MAAKAGKKAAQTNETSQRTLRREHRSDGWRHATAQARSPDRTRLLPVTLRQLPALPLLATSPMYQTNGS